MNDVLISTLFGCVVGAFGTGLGAAIAFLIKKTSERLMAALMGLSGGIMIAIVVFDMCPNALVYASTWVVIVSAIVGAAFVLGTEAALNRRNKNKKTDKEEKILRIGVIIMISIGIHNLPEGLAIGSGLAEPGGYGIGFGMLILIHNIPEGMAMAIPMHMGNMKPAKGIALAMLAGIPTAIGAGIGVALGNVSENLIGICMAFAAGAMLFVSVKELIPESVQLHKNLFTAGAIAVGILVGMAMVYVI